MIFGSDVPSSPGSTWTESQASPTPEPDRARKLPYGDKKKHPLLPWCPGVAHEYDVQLDLHIIDFDASTVKQQRALARSVEAAQEQIRLTRPLPQPTLKQMYTGRVERVWPYNPATKLYKVLLASLSTGKRTMIEMSGVWASSHLLAARLSPETAVTFSAGTDCMRQIPVKRSEPFDRKLLVEGGLKFRLPSAPDASWVRVGSTEMLETFEERVAVEREAVGEKRKQRRQDQIEEAVLALEPALKKQCTGLSDSPGPFQDPLPRNPFANRTYSSFRGHFGDFPTVEQVNAFTSKQKIGGFAGVIHSIDAAVNPTTTGEYSITMKLVDPSSTDLLPCNLFSKMPSGRLPVNLSAGQVVLFRQMETTQLKVPIVLGSSFKDWQCCFLDLECTPDGEDLEYMPIFPWNRSFALTPAERQRMHDLHAWSLNIAKEKQQRKQQTRPLTYIGDMKSGSRCNSVVEILFKMDVPNVFATQMYKTINVTDYTRNPLLQESPNSVFFDKRIMQIQCWDSQKAVIQNMIDQHTLRHPHERLYIYFQNFHVKPNLQGLLGGNVRAEISDIIPISRDHPSIKEIQRRRAMLEDAISKAFTDADDKSAAEVAAAPVICEDFETGLSSLGQVLACTERNKAHQVKIRLVSMEHSDVADNCRRHCSRCRRILPLHESQTADSICCDQPTTWIWALKMLVEDASDLVEHSKKTRAVLNIVGENARIFLSGLEAKDLRAKKHRLENFKRMVSLIQADNETQELGPSFHAMVITEECEEHAEDGEKRKIAQLHLFNTVIDHPPEWKKPSMSDFDASSEGNALLSTPG